MKNTVIATLVIFIASILVSLPLFKTGFYSVHDDQQIARLFLFNQSLFAGQFPVRWVGGLGFGFGYPLFNFYPPFVYMLGELIHIIGFNFINSIKIVFFLGILLSGFSMFILVKELWGRMSGITAAIFYMFAPYRAVDMYVRGALAESFAFVWLPLILWGFYKVSKKQTMNFAYITGFLLALLMITHNLIFLPFTLILMIYVPSLLFLSKNKTLFLKHTFFAGVLGAGLSAFFWLPSLLEKKYTIVDQILLTNLADYRIHFVYPEQLWNWQWGFGGSAKGLADGISFKIGKIHIILTTASLFLMSIYYMRAKFAKRKFILPATFVSLFLFSALMTTMYSQIIWDTIKPLAYLQFPWRFLTFTTLFSSIMAGYFIYFLRLSFLRAIFTGIILIALIVPNYKLFKPQFYRENLTDAEATSAEKINWDVSLSSFEYSPKDVSLKVDQRGVNMIDINKADIPNNKIKMASSDVHFDVLKNTPSLIEFNYESANKTTAQANVFDFPNWSVYIDGRKIEHNSVGKLKLIAFDIPEGFHTISIKFENTRFRVFANLVSAISLLIFAMYFLKKWQTRILN